MSPNENLQAVKLRAIARGLGASLIQNSERMRFLIKWDEFLTASVHYGKWQREGRIIFQAHHPNTWHNRPEITVSDSRPVRAIVRDIQNRFIIPAREFCRKSKEHQQKTQERELNQKLRIQSYLDELGADYEEAKKYGARFSSTDFSARGVSFTTYDLSEDRGSCRVTIDCSGACLRHLLRLVRADYEFHQFTKEKN